MWKTLILFISLIVSLPLSGFSQASKVVALLKGQVTSSSGERLKDVQVAVYKNGEKVNTGKTNSDGKFQIIVQPNAEYRIGYSHPAYYYKEDPFPIPALDAYKEIPVAVSLKALEFGKPYPLSTLIFEPASSAISATAVSDLEGIAQIMKRNNKISLRITVYPDEAPTGKNAAKQNDLASARKAAITTFLLSKNISNYTININNVVPQGRFERTIVVAGDQSTGKKKKSKKPAKTVTKTVLVPQYAEFVMMSLS